MLNNFVFFYVIGTWCVVAGTKNKTYTPKNICSGVSKDRSHREYLA